jgi:uncharacterized protein (DUF488 family)
VDVYTIGFTKKTAAVFFGALRRAGIKRLVDVRLANTSQLAGFAKRDDLRFFLDAICGAEYAHEPLLAPSRELLRAYRGGECGWPEYERRFRALMAARKIEERLDPMVFAGPTVLLCAEPSAERCHRRLVLEYLQASWGGLRAVHL